MARAQDERSTWPREAKKCLRSLGTEAPKDGRRKRCEGLVVRVFRVHSSELRDS